MIKKLAMVFMMVLMLTSLAGCGENKAAEGIVDVQEPEATQEIDISDEFVPVYVQRKAGMNHIVIYHHVPTGQMYVCYVNCSMVPMGITYDEYMEAAKAFHKAAKAFHKNDVVTAAADVEE